MAWVWAHVLGTGEARLRSLSALAGTATVPVAYAVAARAAPAGPLPRIGIVDALAYYVPRVSFFPVGDAAVTEVDVLVMAGSRPAAPRTTTIRHRLGKLGLVPGESIHRSGYDILEFRSGAPIHLDRRGLASLGVGTVAAGRDVLLRAPA